MNIYSFINSKDIANHLKGVNYDFTPLEQAWIVWHSDNKTLKERIDAWIEIGKTHPDFKHKISKFKNHSFSFVLQKYIDFVSFYSDLFKMEKDECYYTFEAHEKNGNYWYNEDKYLIFKNYTACMDYLKAEYSDFPDDVGKIIITKKKFGIKHWYMEAVFNNKFEMLKIDVSGDYENEKDEEIAYLFENMWFDFPTPFKKGDLVVSKHSPFGESLNKQVFVLIDMITWNENKDMYKKHPHVLDMVAYGYFQREDGSLYWEGMHDYFDLEFYREDPKNENRIMFTLSNYIKGEIDELLLLEANKIISLEEQARKRRNSLNVTKEGLMLMGLMENNKTSP